MTLEQILERFPGKQTKKTGETLVLCPAHPDKNPSLGIKESNGKILVCCYAGCAKEAVLEAAGLTLRDLFVDSPVNAPVRRGAAAPARSDPEKVYVYRDEAGEVRSRKRRYYRNGDKTFVIEAKNGSSWDKNNKRNEGTPYENLLYNLPEVLAAIEEGKTIVLNEGEKACDRGKDAGLVCTCQQHGGNPSQFNDHHARILARARTVVIVADRDLDPSKGLRYAKHCAAKIKLLGGNPIIVQSATTGDADDLFDHLEAGHAPSDLVRWVNPDLMTGIVRADSIKPVPVEWWIPQLIPKGMITMCDGEPEAGKSFLSLALTSHFSTGAALWNGYEPEKTNTLILATEDDAKRTIVPRLLSFNADLSRVFIRDIGFAFNEEGLALLEELFVALNIGFCPVDPFLAYLKRALRQRNCELDERGIMDHLKGICERTNASIFAVRHLSKDKANDDPMYAGYGSIDIVASARSAMSVQKVPADQFPNKKRWRVVEQYKMNIAEKFPPFAYEIEGDGHGNPVFWWRGTIDKETMTTIREARNVRRAGNSAKASEELSALENAKSFLLDLLRSGNQVKSDDIIKQAEKAGIAKRTIWRAKDKLGVKATKGGSEDPSWRWYLPTEETIEGQSTDESYRAPYKDDAPALSFEGEEDPFAD